MTGSDWDKHQVMEGEMDAAAARRLAGVSEKYGRSIVGVWKEYRSRLESTGLRSRDTAPIGWVNCSGPDTQP